MACVELNNRKLLYFKCLIAARDYCINYCAGLTDETAENIPKCGDRNRVYIEGGFSYGCNGSKCGRKLCVMCRLFSINHWVENMVEYWEDDVYFKPAKR
jgi:hypothetical protein